jgi:toxin HigB-1
MKARSYLYRWSCFHFIVTQVKTLEYARIHHHVYYRLTVLLNNDTMIVSFASKETELIFNEVRSRSFPEDIQRTALRKLRIIEAATSILDLQVPPGNRIEKLSGDREGQYSIRINDQWRICFTWTDENNAQDVEIIDYH